MTQEVLSEAPPEEDAQDASWTEDEKEVLIQKGLLLTQLLESDKFVQFINLNYDIVREEGTKMMYVIEVPDNVAMERVAGAMKEQAKNQPSLVHATPADLKKLKKRKKRR